MDKIKRIEPALVRGLVQGRAQQLAPVLSSIRPGQSPTVRGHRLRIVDGNHLPVSQKRLMPLRTFRGAALPGQSQVVYDPDGNLVVDLMPGENGHARERPLMPPLQAQAQPGDLGIADRNFSTRGILGGGMNAGPGLSCGNMGPAPIRVRWRGYAGRAGLSRQCSGRTAGCRYRTVVILSGHRNQGAVHRDDDRRRRAGLASL